MIVDPPNIPTHALLGSPSSSESPEALEVILRPGGSSVGYWAELWRYRELFFILAWRDLKVRYKQTTVGIAIQPFPF